MLRHVKINEAFKKVLCCYYCCFFYYYQQLVLNLFQFNSVQLLSHVQLLVTPWAAAHQASLSITNSRSLLKLMSIKLVMLSNHLSICHPLLLLPSLSQHQGLFQ